MPTSFTIEKLTRYRNRAMASFIVDDGGAFTPGDADAFKRFSEWVEGAGLKGECSAICGLQRDDRGRARRLDRGYAAEVARACGNHLDAYMEVMTHAGVYDFAAGRVPADAPHEGVWLNDRSRKLDEYRGYLQHVAGIAQAAGFRHAGLTQPGCGCPACLEFFSRNRLVWDAKELNPLVYEAMLGLAKEGRLASGVCGVFVGWVKSGPADLQLLCEDGSCAVYDTTPGVAFDLLGRWDNDPGQVNIDAYITPDGAEGRLPELLAQGTQTLIYYGHWQGLRPDRGVGFPAFQEVASRLQRHHGERIVWMRPTQIAAYRHTERHTQIRAEDDGRAFHLSIPFAAPHPLSIRIMGSSTARLRLPDGKVLASTQSSSGQAWAMFDLVPRSGRYEVVEG